MNEPYFDLNNDCMVYCKKDVEVLKKSILKFLAQAFQFQDLLCLRYGNSPALKSRSLNYFHPFSDQTTIGSYRYVSF